MTAIKTVGVIGAGQMGAGIAQVAAQAGHDVCLADKDLPLAQKGVDGIAAGLLRLVDKGKLDEGAAADVSARIAPVGSLGDLSSCDLVIEAVSESEQVKRAIFADLCAHLKDDAVLATNTSSLSITRLAAATDRPTRFMGVHFMNPAPVMKLVELVRGLQTDEDIFTDVKAAIEAMGKSIVVSEDSPAFMVNRVLIPMINEACYALFEGVGSVEDIDAAMKLGANHPMGPFTLADFIGLDTCVAILRVLYDELGGIKYKPCPLLVKYVDAGWLGRKSGRGFYDYSGG